MSEIGKKLDTFDFVFGQFLGIFYQKSANMSSKMPTGTQIEALLNVLNILNPEHFKTFTYVA